MESSTAPHTRHAPAARQQHHDLDRESGHRRPLHTAAKRAIDFVSALLLLTVLSPVMILVALAVRLDSPGPILFRQRRLGRNMVPFTVYKFRTMGADSSPELHRRYIAALANGENGSNGNGHLNGSGNGNGEIKKLTQDPRVTTVGRFLRRVSLDELPQLFNVVGGTMSLIGPRPALEYELEHYGPIHYRRFDVRPGITGLWQVSGRNRLGFTEMLDLDVKYSEEANLLTDVGIVLRTPLAAVRHSA
jgi:lipopolysaccharide/colanic/teichoic acid biosynthesis glycosyltransferase